MFDFVRKHNKVVQIALFALILPSFVIGFGINSYNSMRDKGDVVATVAGKEITQTEWDAAHKNEINRIVSTNPKIDVKLLDTPQARYATLERLVQSRAVRAEADKAMISVPDQKLTRVYAEDPMLASFRTPDGKFDRERFSQATNMTPEQYDASLRANLQLRQIGDGVSTTGLVSQAQADTTLNAFLEQREIQVQNFAASLYTHKAAASDEEVMAYYKQHSNLFQAPEQANIEYVMLDTAVVSKSITLSEQDVKTYYEQNAAKLAGPEERHARHILIKAEKDSPAADRQKAKTFAEQLLAQVKKSPTSFADVAKKNSQDEGSAAKGGDLGFFLRDAMVKPFSDATFAMKKGDISDLVESDFGYHIIQLVDIKAPQAGNFETMRPSIEADLRKQMAQKKFSESAEIFTNTVFEQSTSFKPVVDKLKLDIATANQVTRNPAADAKLDPKSPLRNPKFLAALFSSDSLQKKRNTEAVDLGGNQLISGRIVSYTPAQTIPFEAAKGLAKEKLLSERSLALAKKDGAEKLAAWKANATATPAGANLSPALVISRDQSQGMPPALVEAVLRTDKTKLPAFVGVDLGEAGFGIAKVNKVIDRKLEPGQLDQGKEQYNKLWTAAENAAYMNLLKNRFRTTIKVKQPSADTAQASSVN